MKLHHETTIKESQARNIPPIFILEEHKTTICRAKRKYKKDINVDNENYHIPVPEDSWICEGTGKDNCT